VSDRWTQGAQADFSKQFVKPGAGWVHLPAKALVKDLAAAPEPVRSAVDRYGSPDPARGEKAQVYAVELNGSTLFAVHTRSDDLEQVTLYDRLGGLVTWGSASEAEGFFWED
jgi:hypothetical protein